MSRAKQFVFSNISDEFKDYWKETGRQVHGGAYAKGKRKTARPFSSKKPLHLIMRALRAKGSLSLWNYKTQIKNIIEEYAELCEITVYKFSNNGNHLHILLRAKDHKLFKKFMRTTTGLIARLVLDAKKGDAKGKFWDALAFTRIAEWGKAFRNVQKYVLQNILEAAGVLPYQPRKYKAKMIESTA